MTLLASQPEASNMIAQWQLITTIGLGVIAAFWVILQIATKNKDKAQGKDLVILKQDIEGKLGKEKGTREIKELELMNTIVNQGTAQNAINERLETLITDIHDDRKEEHIKWAGFLSDHSKYMDKTNDILMHVQSEVSVLKQEVPGIKRLVEKSVEQLNEAKETYRKASEKTTQ